MYVVVNPYIILLISHFDFYKFIAFSSNFIRKSNLSLLIKISFFCLWYISDVAVKWAFPHQFFVLIIKITNATVYDSLTTGLSCSQIISNVSVTSTAPSAMNSNHYSVPKYYVRLDVLRKCITISKMINSIYF